jgi:hypothetical protein
MENQILNESAAAGFSLRKFLKHNKKLSKTGGEGPLSEINCFLDKL